MFRKGHRRRFSAIFSAEIIDFSRLVSMGDDATMQTLIEYKELILSEIVKYKGWESNAEGPIVLAEFPNAEQAVLCAVKISNEIDKRNVYRSNPQKIHIRMGVNLGDLKDDGNGIQGKGVVVAKGLAASANQGEIRISERVYTQIRKNSDLGLEYLGKQPVGAKGALVRTYAVLTAPMHAGKLVDNITPKWKRHLSVNSAVLAGLILIAGALFFWSQYKDIQNMAPPAVGDNETPAEDQAGDK